jgi:hypothetical protein
MPSMVFDPRSDHPEPRREVSNSSAPGGPPEAPQLNVTSRKTTENDDKMICERCGKAEMYRMHAVWRCPECGFKTDCCGW